MIEFSGVRSSWRHVGQEARLALVGVAQPLGALVELGVERDDARLVSSSSRLSASIAFWRARTSPSACSSSSFWRVTSSNGRARAAPRELGAHGAHVGRGAPAGSRLATVTRVPRPAGASISNSSISCRTPTSPRPRPVLDVYSPRRTSSRFGMPGPVVDDLDRAAASGAQWIRTSPPPA